MFPEEKPRGTLRVEGKQNSLFNLVPRVSHLAAPSERRETLARWSRVSQNLGDDNQIVKGRGGLVGILSILNLRDYMTYCHKNKVNLSII